MAHAHGRYTGARVLFIKKLKVYTQGEDFIYQWHSCHYQHLDLLRTHLT